MLRKTVLHIFLALMIALVLVIASVQTHVAHAQQTSINVDQDETCDGHYVGMRVEYCYKVTTTVETGSGWNAGCVDAEQSGGYYHTYTTYWGYSFYDADGVLHTDEASDGQELPWLMLGSYNSYECV